MSEPSYLEMELKDEIQDKDAEIADLKEQVRVLLDQRAKNAPIDVAGAYGATKENAAIADVKRDFVCIRRSDVLFDARQADLDAGELIVPLQHGNANGECFQILGKLRHFAQLLADATEGRE